MSDLELESMSEEDLQHLASRIALELARREEARERERRRRIAEKYTP